MSIVLDDSNSKLPENNNSFDELSESQNFDLISLNIQKNSFGSLQNYRTITWKAFSKYSCCVGDLPLDMCELGIKYDQLHEAVKSINKNTQFNKIIEMINKFQFKLGDTISWKEFRYFVDSIFLSKKESSVFNNDGNDDSFKAKVSTPYNQLLRKNRSASTVIYDNNIDAPYDSKTSISFKLGNFRLSDQIVSKALSTTIRSYSNTNLKPAKRSSELVNNPNKKREYIVDYSANQNYGFDRELNKQKIHTLLNPEDSYISKWNDMIKKRDERKYFENFKKEQSSVKNILNKTIELNRR